ncbi:hypothetical protein HYH02_007295 [Chlamydomonas schloesseri]|uniref:Uncharacterized protein n=1 Tax=Chlamydomonas schloesseri TaxID=2026947 RepID=A0A835WHS9_9CHLO|nr:hypothetical protein HYH02_007295 [Chlamydomonas schloesseri]|eukprot:KAG2447839.1 hypothetical protein HYH02_007295 [Chlamydomonas schloesseri]
MALLMRSQTVRPVSAVASRRVAVVVRAQAADKPSTNITGKAKLVDVISQEAGLTKEVAAKAFDALIGGIEDAVIKGERVTIVGFGTFEVRERKARQGRNPSTGAVIQIPASKAPAFKASAGWKDAINGKTAAPKAAPAAKPAAAPKAAAPKPAAPKPAQPGPKPGPKK